jgi:DNA-binding NtrC family response regulator
MSNSENEIRSRVETFVNDLSDLVRQAALEAVTEALKKGDVQAPARKVGRPAKAAAPVEAQEEKKSAARTRGRPAAPKGGQKRRAGEKRSPQILAQVTEQVFNHIKANAGQGVEQIAKALGTTTKELTLPIRKLLADKKITSKGQKRATRYFPR